MKIGDTVLVEYAQGTYKGEEDGFYLVDTGKEIKKSMLRPVVHELPEGYYKNQRGTVLEVTHHPVAWARENARGALVLQPVYHYRDHSRPPFGSDLVLEPELETWAPVENPFMHEAQVEAVLREHEPQLLAHHEAVRAAEAELDKAKAARRELQNEINDKLKLCPHEWEKDGDEEEVSEGRSWRQEWTCTICGKSHTQSYSRLL